MNQGELRKALERKGLSPVGALYALSVLQVPHIISVHVKGNDGKEWEITSDGHEYYMEKV